METNNLSISASPMSEPIVFAIDFGDPGAGAPASPEGNCPHSIVVWIEPQDALFISSATEPEAAMRTFAEALAKRTALSAIEKDIPTGVELTVSARKIDRVPSEVENRLPDFCMNGNKAWLVGPERGDAEPFDAENAAA